MEDIQQGKVNYYHQLEYALELKNIDIRVSFVASSIYINFFSIKSMREFIKKCPKYIDRHNIAHSGFGKLFPKALMHDHSNDNWKKRREKLLKEIGINFTSKHIPTMINAVGDKIKTWEDGMV